MKDLDYIFKIGDLVQMDNEFRHCLEPPIGTLGFVTKTEQYSSDILVGETDQYIWVHWAHEQNLITQCYTEASLKLVISLNNHRGTE